MAENYREFFGHESSEVASVVDRVQRIGPDRRRFYISIGQAR